MAGDTTRRSLVGLIAAIPLAAAASSTDTSDRGRPMIETDGSPLAARNIAAIRSHHAVMNEGDFRKAALSYAENTQSNGHTGGRAGLVKVFEDIYTTFPDWRMSIDEIAGVGEAVIARMTVTGTHRGIGTLPINGGLLMGIPPTGRQFSVRHIHWYGMSNGLITSHWAERGDIDMMQQLGLLPTPPRGG